MSNLFDFYNDNGKKSQNNTDTLKQGLKFKNSQNKIRKNGNKPQQSQSRPQFFSNIQEGFEEPPSKYIKKREDLINEVDNNVILQVQQLKDLQSNYSSVLNQYNASVGNLNNATKSYIQNTNDSSNYNNANVFVSTLASDPSTVTGTYKGSYNVTAAGMTSVGTGLDYGGCKSAALKSGYTIFGLQNTDIDVAGSSECVGTNDIKSATAGGVYKSSCSAGSDGNKYGGGWTNAVYSIDPVNKTTSYTGCYKDNSIRAMVSTGPNMGAYQPVYVLSNPPWSISTFPKDTGAEWIWYTENSGTGAPVNSGNPTTLIYNYINNTGSIIDIVLWGICDDYADIYVNSQLMGSIPGGWDGAGTASQIPMQIMPGSNYIQASVVNGGGPAGLIMAAVPKGVVLKPEPTIINSAQTIINSTPSPDSKSYLALKGLVYTGPNTFPEIDNGTIQECADACASEPDCVGAWYNPIDYSYPKCWPTKEGATVSVNGNTNAKNDYAIVPNDGTYNVPSKQYTATIGSTFWGSGNSLIDTITNGTMQECANSCAANASCSGATYNPSDHDNTPYCWLVSGQGPIGGGITNDYAIVPGNAADFSNSSSILFKTDSSWKWTNVPPSEMVPNAQNFSFDTCKSFAEQNGYQYFGLQDGTTGTAQCFVSNDLASIKKYGSADNSFKLGDGNIYGGPNVTAVYDTGMDSNLGLLGKMGYVNETGQLSEYPANMFNASDPNNISVSNNASCNKSVNKIDTAKWSSYANTGTAMSADTTCGLTKATTTQEQQAESLQQQLSTIAQQIVDKINYLETLNVSMLKQMGLDRNTLNRDLSKYKEVITQFNTITNKEMMNINGIMADTETNVLMENYNYMFWGILALAMIIITIHFHSSF